MHNPESVLESETLKVLWDFETQTDHLISVWQKDLVIVNSNKKRKKKENRPNSELSRSGWPQGKTKRKWEKI